MPNWTTVLMAALDPAHPAARDRDAPAVLTTLLDTAAAAHGGDPGADPATGVTFPGAAAAAAAATDVATAPGAVTGAIVIAIHTGESPLGGGGAEPPVVTATRRILAMGGGGDILLSAAAVRAAGDDLPGRMSLTPLGSLRPPDLAAPVDVWLLHGGERPPHPARRSIDAVPNNLPTRLTSFVGRSEELADLEGLVGAERLVTVHGQAGVGKSRLALQAAAAGAPRFPGGIWTVDLTTIRDGTRIPRVTATALGIGSAATRPLIGGEPGVEPGPAVFDFLKGKRSLVVFDGCEHVTGAAASFIGECLQVCPEITVVATSRELLGVPGERHLHVPPLDVPDEAEDKTWHRLELSPAVRLFADRASDVAPGFVLDPRTAPVVARICRRLDGLPLAIELAAARVYSLDVEQIDARLDDRFRLLGPVGGDGGRHTLRAAIDWSYDLLDPQERTLFEIVSVFSGGFTLDAAEYVAGTAGPLPVDDVPGLVAQLVEKSMLETEGRSPGLRYRMTRNLRSYAVDRLAAREDGLDPGPAHARYFLDLAERAHPALRGREQRHWLARLEAEAENLEDALQRAVATGDRELALRLIASLYWFWFVRRDRRARSRVEQALSLPGEAAPEIVMRATIGGGLTLLLDGAIAEAVPMLARGGRLADDLEAPESALEVDLYEGLVAQTRGDHGAAAGHFRDALDIAHRIRDPFSTAWSLWFLGGNARRAGEDAEATRLVEAALEAFRSIKDDFGSANCHIVLGSLARSRRDFIAARRHYEEALDRFRDLGDPIGTLSALQAVAGEASEAGEHTEAVALLEQAVRMARHLGNRERLADASLRLSRARRAAGAFAAATAAARESLQLAGSLSGGEAETITTRALRNAAALARDLGEFGRAAVLFGAAAAGRERAGAADDDDTGAVQRDEAAVRVRLGTETAGRLWARGAAMDGEAAVAFALSTEPVHATREDELAAIAAEEGVARALGPVGVRRGVRLGGLRIGGRRRRRPSGEKPPLPRELRASGWFWLITGLVIAGVWISLLSWTDSAIWWTNRDMSVIDFLVDLRTSLWNDVMQGVQVLGSVWVIRPVRWGALLALVFFKRWRHLVGAIVVILIVETVALGIADAVGRPRPFVPIIGDWSGYAHPSLPVARLSVTMALFGLTLLPRGIWRRRWFVLGGILVAMLGIANIYLGVDHPTDAVMAALLGVSVAVVFFRLWVPEQVFPVTYRRGRAAHLALDPQRREAIISGLRDQLGVEALDLRLFGTAASGGSTPMRIKIAEEPDRHVFAKLYSSVHLRSDRWYKLGRTILYGTLEDEVRFASVRRLVEYEDYILLLMRNAGLPSPEPYGFVEITPEREYLLVFEFLEGAQEITDAEVDDAVIDEALQVVRRMWDAGLAHRDIKPANVMVRGGRVVLVDVAFATIRPTPWRQAVDLANMMMILALRTDPERVYRRALRFFSPDDIAEAFAATRSITIPMQSRASIQQLKRGEGRDLIHEFRALAPPRDLISVQRWSPRRVAITAGVLLLGLMMLGMLIENITGGGFI